MGSINTTSKTTKPKRIQRDKMKISLIFICLFTKGTLGIPLSLDDILGPGDVGDKAPSTYQNCNCQCDSYTWTDGNVIRGNCKSQDDTNGALFCYVTGDALCSCRDVKVSTTQKNSDGTSKLYSYEACTTPPRNSCSNISLQNFGSGDFQHCQTGQSVKPSGSGTNCRTEYKTVNVIVETEKFETKCVEKYINQCVQSQSVFVLLAKNKFAKPYTMNNVTPNTGKIAMKLTGMLWNLIQKMFVLIKVNVDVKNIGNVLILTNLLPIVMIKFGLKIKIIVKLYYQPNVKMLQIIIQ